MHYGQFGGPTRPLVRWTIGPVSAPGYDCLAESIRLWRVHFGDSFDMVVCHNDADEARLAALGVPLYRQRGDELRGMPPPPHGARETCAAWKLYPPRLRFPAHEVFVDNDCILTRPPAALLRFLGSRDSMLGMPVVRSRAETAGRSSQYGRLSRLARGPLRNAGLFGLRPLFDLEAALRLDLLGGEWGGYFDDQGLIGVALQGEKCHMIARGEVGYCVREGIDRPVLHFVGLNRNAEHPYWGSYLASRRAREA